MKSKEENFSRLNLVLQSNEEDVRKEAHIDATMLSVGRWKVYQLMKEGRLRFVDRDIGRRVRHCWIDEFMSGKADGGQDRAR